MLIEVLEPYSVQSATEGEVVMCTKTIMQRTRKDQIGRISI